MGMSRGEAGGEGTRSERNEHTIVTAMLMGLRGRAVFVGRVVRHLRTLAGALVGLSFSALIILQALREELSETRRGQLKVFRYLPDWDWPWWIVAVCLVAVVLILESAFREHRSGLEVSRLRALPERPRPAATAPRVLDAFLGNVVWGGSSIARNDEQPLGDVRFELIITAGERPETVADVRLVFQAKEFFPAVYRAGRKNLVSHASTNAVMMSSRGTSASTTWGIDGPLWLSLPLELAPLGSVRRWSMFMFEDDSLTWGAVRDSPLRVDIRTSLNQTKSLDLPHPPALPVA